MSKLDLATIRSNEAQEALRAQIAGHVTALMLDRETSELVGDIAQMVSEESGVPVADIMSKSSKKRRVSGCRKLIFLHARKLGMTSVDIARHFDIDHSTVSAGVSAIMDHLSITPYLTEKSGEGN